MAGVQPGVVLFDLDGTLTASAPGIIRSVTAALGELQRPLLDEAALLRFIGPPLLDSFREIAGLDEVTALDAMVAYRRLLRRIRHRRERRLPGHPRLTARACRYRTPIGGHHIEAVAVRRSDHRALCASRVLRGGVRPRDRWRRHRQGRGGRAGARPAGRRRSTTWSSWAIDGTTSWVRKRTASGALVRSGVTGRARSSRAPTRSRRTSTSSRRCSASRWITRPVATTPSRSGEQGCDRRAAPAGRPRRPCASPRPSALGVAHG